jgi:hypothetical protein
LQCADFIRTTITPVVEAELSKLKDAAAVAFVAKAAEALGAKKDIIAQVPAHLDMDSVSGLVVVHLTHAADNFSIKYDHCHSERCTHICTRLHICVCSR